MKRISVIAIALLSLGAAHASEEYRELFESALEAVDWQFDENWAYTQTMLEDDKLWVGRFDPRNVQDGGWTLLSVDGRAPTEDEIEDYLDDRDDGNRADISITSIVEPGTLELLEETDAYWLFSFMPSDDEEEFFESVDATVRIGKRQEGHYIEYIDMRNHSDIDAGFGTTLTQFLTRFSFAPAVAGGPVVPTGVQVRIAGRALLFISISETEAVENSDFEYAGEDASSVEALADEIVAATLERYPSMGTYLGIEGAAHDRLFDNSLGALGAWQARQDKWLAKLKAIRPPQDVGSRDWVSYHILIESLEGDAATRLCHSELWQASNATGWHRSLPFVFDVQPVATADERQQALDRLAAVAGYIDTEITNLTLGLERGYSAPRVTVEAVPDAVRALLDDDSIFLDPATRAGDAVFAKDVRKIFDEQITPAVNRFADFVENDYLPAARETIALSANPDGRDCYPALVRAFSTLELSPDEVHQLGLAQIERITGEMRVVIDEHFGGGPISDFLRRINNEAEFTFASEDAVLQYSVDALEGAKAAMSTAFGRLPKADVLVKPYPAFAEGGVGEYHASSEDGSRPGIFYIAVTTPEKRTRAFQQSTLYHETYPGHHLQGAIARELGDQVHAVARYFGNSGFSEGWGLYAERLADELGLYGDALDYLGMLSEQGARASRLVIDTGLHTKGWTRQQAVDYMLAHTAWSEVDIQNDIDRYIAWPGQATSYMLGMLEIVRLRELAEQELGADFVLSDFHDRVVGFGGITLPMLHASILAWIEEQRAD
jgi:uncharacterized protein (DUF885 family)